MTKSASVHLNFVTWNDKTNINTWICISEIYLLCGYNLLFCNPQCENDFCLVCCVVVVVYVCVVRALGSHPFGCEFKAYQVQVYFHPRKKTPVLHITPLGYSAAKWGPLAFG